MELVTVSAIIVTRGDIDISEILTSLLSVVDEVLIWDNSGEVQILVEHPQIRWLNYGGPDLAVYGRYAAIEYASGDLIYVQDDDCVVSDPQALIRKWKDTRNAGLIGKTGVLNLHSDTDTFVVANMPQPFRHDFYSDHCLVGFGAVFHRDLPKRAFERFRAEWHWDDTESKYEEWLNRTCDVVFTALTPRVIVDVPYENLSWADGPDRMYRQREHVAERTRMLELVRQVRDADVYHTSKSPDKHVRELDPDYRCTSRFASCRCNRRTGHSGPHWHNGQAGEFEWGGRRQRKRGPGGRVA
jgi:hypothetical protein